MDQLAHKVDSAVAERWQVHLTVDGKDLVQCLLVLHVRCELSGVDHHHLPVVAPHHDRHLSMLWRHVNCYHHVATRVAMATTSTLRVGVDLDLLIVLRVKVSLLFEVVGMGCE